ncbi:MAG: PAS domain-containing protein [Candidatus Binatia bacterium]
MPVRSRPTRRRARDHLAAGTSYLGLLTPAGTLLFADGPHRVPGCETWEGRPLWELPCWSTGETAPAQIRRDLQAAAAGQRVRRSKGGRDDTGRPVTITTTYAPLRDASGAIRFVLAEAMLHPAPTPASGRDDRPETPTPLHEANNALGSLKNALVLLRATIGPDHPTTRYVDVAERQTERLVAALRESRRSNRRSPRRPKKS